MAVGLQTGSSRLKQFIARDYQQRELENTHGLGPPEEHPYMRLYPPLQHFLRLPYPTRPKDMESVMALHLAHTTLRDFWAKVEAWRASQFRMTALPPDVVQGYQYNIFVVPKLGLEDPWPGELASLLAAIAVEGVLKKETCELKSDPHDKKSRPPTSSHAISSKPETSDEPDARPKEKTKTRPEAPDKQHADSVEAPTVTESANEKLSVTQASLRVFTRMYDAGAEDGKATRWVDFIAALADAGFAITQSRGSAVSFKDSSSKGAIVFHRPHPDPNVNIVMLRNMGKRLSKWFGWQAGVFVEREKEGA